MSSAVVEPLIFVVTVKPVGWVVSPFLATDVRSFTSFGSVAVHVLPLILTPPLFSLVNTRLVSSFNATDTTVLLLFAFNPPNVPVIVREVEVTLLLSNVGFGGVAFTVTAIVLLGWTWVAPGRSEPVTCDFGKVILTWNVCFPEVVALAFSLTPLALTHS